MTIPQRFYKDKFLASVEILGEDDCWLWRGRSIEDHGNSYGMIPIPGAISRARTISAHRAAFEIFCYPIPDGLVIDHLCRNGLCVNPKHLEPVPNRENVLRGYGSPAINARKTHCNYGHEFNEKNTHIGTGGKRVCRACEKARSSRRAEAKRFKS